MTAGPSQAAAMMILLAGMLLVLGSALAFEHIGGYAPCALCLEQRTPYYLGIPLVALGIIGQWMRFPPPVPRGALAVGLLCMLATGALGFYHSGVEWGFFEVPATCGAGLSATDSDAGSLLDSLATTTPPKCDEAAGRFLGLSFAGWNVVAAAGLATVAAKGLFGKPT
ncbi:MAG: disulfide bond formation protein B [Pseudomonadota bacterium]